MGHQEIKETENEDDHSSPRILQRI